MKYFRMLLIAAFSCLGPFLFAGAGGGFAVEENYQEGEYQAWTGPGWYYGIWFDNEASYDNWLEFHFYDARWIGPGWYYGVWFTTEIDFNNYRHHYHHYPRGHYKGHHYHHQGQHRGYWRGGGHRGGGGHGGGHHGGRH